jgi:hypothetical protein
MSTNTDTRLSPSSRPAFFRGRPAAQWIDALSPGREARDQFPPANEVRP